MLYPSRRTGGPRSVPSAVARHPALSLWPTTSHASSARGPTVTEVDVRSWAVTAMSGASPAPSASSPAPCVAPSAGVGPQGEGVDLQAQVAAVGGLEAGGPLRQREGVAPREGQRVAGLGGGGVAGDPDGHGLAVQLDQVGPAAGVDPLDGRRGAQAVDAPLGDPDRHHHRALRHPVRGGHRAGGGDADPDVGAGHGSRQVEPHGGGRVGLVGVGDRRDVDHRDLLAVDLDAQRGGHRVATVGDDGEVEVVEGDRRGRLVARPLGVLAQEARAPVGGRVAVDRRGGAGADVAGQAPGRRRRDPALVGRRPAQQRVDHGFGSEGGEPHGAGHRRVARRRQLQQAHHGGFLVRPERRGRAGPQTGQHDGEGPVERGRTEGVEQVGGRADGLVEADVVVAEADVGEPDAALVPVVDEVAGVGGGDLDGQALEGPRADVDPLAFAGPRGLVEAEGLRGPVVDADADLGDPAPLHPVGRLEEADAVGGPGRVVGELDPLALRGGEGRRVPGGAQVVVDRLGRPVLGGVGDRVAVARGAGRQPLVHDHGLGVGTGAREDREPVVAGVGDEHAAVHGLGGAVGLVDRAPPPGRSPVRVGEDEGGALVRRRPQGILTPAPLGREGGRVAQRLVAVDQPGRGGGDDALGVAGQQDGRGDGLRRHHGRLALDLEQAHLGWVRQVGVGRQLELVPERQARVGDVGLGAAEAGHRSEPLGLLEEGEGLAGTHEVVALVGEVGSEHDVADAHQPGHGGDRLGVEDGLLQLAVERVEQVGRGR